MIEDKVASPEIFSALCAEDFSPESQLTESYNQNRTTCMSDKDNLIWDD